MPEAVTPVDRPIPVIAPPASPTGLPVLPPAIVPWLTLAGLVGAVIASAPDMGVALPVAVVSAGKLIFGVCSLLGLASPGWRKVQP